MLAVGTIITAQQQYGQPFTGEIVGYQGKTYVVKVDAENGNKAGHFRGAGLLYVFEDDIIPNAVDLDKLKKLYAEAHA